MPASQAGRRGFKSRLPLCVVSGTLQDTPADSLINQTLNGRLRVLRRIGEGGMGTVYVAEHVDLGKHVAVKVLNAQYAGQSDLISRLHSEARHAAAIHNEHIVDVFDIGVAEDGRPYVVMELLQGESLAERLRRCPVLSEVDTLRIGRQLASALAAAHKSGIVHRDIKPENIFLCPREGGDFVKVLDFGISKAASTSSTSPGEPLAKTADPRLTRTGAILGTPLYMSPEQVRGETLDHRVDIYGFGIVLYECLTGSVPFLAPSYLAVIAKILTETPAPPRERCPERALPEALEQIVLRAMAHDREARYPSMDTLLEDLERYAAGRALQQATWLPATASAPLLTRDETRRPRKKHRDADNPNHDSDLESGGESRSPAALPLVPILVSAGVVLGVGLLLTLWRNPAPPPPPASAKVTAPPPVAPPPALAVPSAAPVPLSSPPAPNLKPEESTVAIEKPVPVRSSRPQRLPAPQALRPERDGALRSNAQDSPERKAPAPHPQPLLEEQAPNPFLPPKSPARPAAQ